LSPCSVGSSSSTAAAGRRPQCVCFHSTLVCHKKGRPSHADAGSSEQSADTAGESAATSQKCHSPEPSQLSQQAHVHMRLQRQGQRPQAGPVHVQIQLVKSEQPARKCHPPEPSQLSQQAHVHMRLQRQGQRPQLLQCRHGSHPAGADASQRRFLYDQRDEVGAGTCQHPE
jgi:hypothetical protein